MAPKVKSKKTKTRISSRIKSLPKAKKVTSKKSSVNSRSKSRTAPKTPKSKKKKEEIRPEDIFDPFSTPVEECIISKKDVLVTPKIVNYCLSAYKHSPDFMDLKKKQFNTSFNCTTSLQDLTHINISSSEEENSPKCKDSLLLNKNKIQGVPGEKYARVFLSFPDFSDSDDELQSFTIENSKTKSLKSERKTSFGYNGAPLSDECLLADYYSSFCSPD